MRRSPLALALCLGACSFQIGPASSGEIDAPPFTDDGGGLSESWSFDTAAELSAPGHERTAMAIEPRGSLTPEGYIYGGLLGRGLTMMKLWEHGDTGWGKLATVTPAAAGLWSGDALTTGDDLDQFGIRRNAVMRTMWFEGELLLAAGAEQLKLRGDDVAFLEIAMPGTSTFVPILENVATPTAVVTVPTSGWYPVRIGWADGNSSGSFALEIQGAQGFESIAPHRMRASVASVQGTMRTVFYRQIYGGGVLGRIPPVQHLQHTPLFPTMDFAPPLQGSLIDPTSTTSDVTDWSARWAGQFYASIPGQYTVRVNSDDGNRLFLGTAPVTEMAWNRDDSNGSSSTTATAALREGWNDLIVDYNQNTGSTLLGIRILASPDPMLGPDVELPLARLRPVEPRHERLIVRSVVPQIPLAVADDTGIYTDVRVPVAASANQNVTRVDATIVYNSDSPDQLLFHVIRPGGTSVVVNTHPGETGGSRRVTHGFSLDPALVGAPADGMWAVGVADDVNGIGTNTTTIAEVHLTLHTAGGPEQIEPAATWRTPIKDLGTQLVKIDAITWDDRTPAGTAVELRLRSCDQADCSDEASWGDALAKGMPVVLPQRRYLQAQVTMTSDGASEAELRSLQITYRRTAM